MINTNLFEYENRYLSQGCRFIAGMDEAGRGPLAGPVMVGCCIMDTDHIIEGVNDSKALTAKKRDELYDKIIERAICYKTIAVSEEEIDQINILNATKKAMKEAVSFMFPIPEILLVDAVKLDFGIPSLSIIHGDALSYSIACASILAKVERDRLMEKYALEYPEYGFDKHKGYGTKIHIESLQKYGPCPIHRRTFIKNFFS